MAKTIRATIGFISPISATSSHFNSFRALIPKDVQLDLEGLGLVGNSLYDDLKGKTQSIVKVVSDVAKRHSWDGLIVSGAPVELLPGFRVRSSRIACDVLHTTHGQTVED